MQTPEGSLSARMRAGKSAKRKQAGTLDPGEQLAADAGQISEAQRKANEAFAKQVADLEKKHGRKATPA